VVVLATTVTRGANVERLGQGVKSVHAGRAFDAI